MDIKSFNSKNLFHTLKQLRTKQYVLLGESTHGTEEFYKIRLIITMILVQKYDFNIVLFETDWSIGYELNKFIHSQLKGNIKTILNRLIQSYPKWMVNNEYIMKLLLFLKQWNLTHSKKVYFYGVDCQDIDLAYKNVCEDDNLNCFLVKKIIQNYHTMKKSDQYWNYRDKFWKFIMDQIKKEQQRKKEHSKFILWAHNSHIGDCKANHKIGNKINIGYLLSNTYQCFKIGFSTYEGSVKASPKWNSTGKRFKLNKPTEGSYEYLFHEICQQRKENAILYFPNPSKKMNLFLRYIGVIYDHKNEMSAHYVKTNINKEFDLFIFIDQTNYLKQSTASKTVKKTKSDMKSLQKMVQSINFQKI